MSHTAYHVGPNKIIANCPQGFQVMFCYHYHIERHQGYDVSHFIHFGFKLLSGDHSIYHAGKFQFLGGKRSTSKNELGASLVP